MERVLQMPCESSVFFRHQKKNTTQKPLEQWKNPGCLGCIGDYTTDTTQLYGDVNKPI